MYVNFMLCDLVAHTHNTQDALEVIKSAIDEGSVFMSADPSQSESVYQQALDKTDEILGPANPARIEVSVNF